MTGIPPMSAVMTPFPFSVEIDAPLAEARRMMDEHDIRHLPVKQGAKLVGVIAERDTRGREGASLAVRDVCEQRVYLVRTREPLDRVLRHMADQHIEAALVVKDERLAGIFTLTDACSRFADLLRTLFPDGSGHSAA